MKVNRNISAVISNAQLHRTEDNLAESIKRLSSGYKINQAKDNPSGTAISNKMRAQINALSQADRNAGDGTSVIQTVDGALNETMSILQRMRELAVQSATDSMTPTDKKACQDEFVQLTSELDRISKDTEFNSKSLIDGSLERRVFSDQNVSNFRTSEYVDSKEYEFTGTPGRRARGSADFSSLVDGQEHKVSLNGYTFEVKGDANNILDSIRDGAEAAGISIDANGLDIDFVTDAFGKADPIEIIVDDAPFGATPTDEMAGTDATVKLTNAAGEAVGFSETATWASNGNRVTITDQNGFEMSFTLGDENYPDGTSADQEYRLEVTDIGAMKIQIGAHEAQEIPMSIPPVDSVSLMLDSLNLVISGGADRAIAAVDDAIAQVSGVRSRIGAYENRLDHAVKSIEATNENMEAAISRILDTDMAEEMSNYSNQQILDQAAISVLSQANDMPQQVLQLLS